jgi:hypothetical protein
MSEYDLIIISSHPQAVSYSGDFVVHPSVDDSNQGLTLVPVRHRSRRADIGKRHLRRPFTVAEVEVLVQAVENLRIGRINGKRLSTLQRLLHTSVGENPFHWSCWIGLFMHIHTGQNDRPTKWKIIACKDESNDPVSASCGHTFCS